MKTSHTPGPWLLAESDGTFVYALNEQGFNRFYAHVQDAHTPKEELRANAKLIQAAPDLLEALEEIVKNDPFKQSSAGIIARAAIQKATGE